MSACNSKNSIICKLTSMYKSPVRIFTVYKNTQSLNTNLKAAAKDIFYMDEMTVYNSMWNGSLVLTNPHRNIPQYTLWVPQLPYYLLFWFSQTANLLFWLTLTALTSIIYSRRRQLFSATKSSDKLTVRYLPSTKLQTKLVTNWTLAEHSGEFRS